MPWLLAAADFDSAQLLVSYFDSDSGDLLETLFFSPIPENVTAGASRLRDTAGSPVGDFAALLSFVDRSVPGNNVQLVVTGSPDGATYSEWVTPWSSLEASLLHVGWDGEAFSVFSFNQADLSLRLVRLSVDGTLLLGPVDVGRVTSLQDNAYDFHTDAETGTTWAVSDLSEGIWLTGIERDGTLVEGMDPVAGGMAVNPFGEVGSSRPRVTSNGDRVLVSWYNTNPDETYYQEVVAGELVGETVVVLDPAASKPVQDRVPWVRDDGWWLAHYVAIEGIQSLRFDGAQPELEGLLIDHDSCYLDSSCLGVTHHDFLPARFLQAEGRDDDRWFGFWDRSDCFEAPGHEELTCPYRIVRVVDGCSYPTAFEIAQEAAAN